MFTGFLKLFPKFDELSFKFDELFSNLVNFSGICEDIGQLIFSICVVDGDVALQHMVTKKMMTNLDVLCLQVLNWVVSNLDSTLIVVA